MRCDIAALSDIGRRKKRNEDSYGLVLEGAEGVRLFQEGALLCVADGLGGHLAGDIASKLAVSIVKDISRETQPALEAYNEFTNKEDLGPLPLMRNAIVRANESIYRTNRDNNVLRNKPMGTTILAAVVEPKWVYVANVGDSRCYLIRAGEIIERTEDHSWVDEQVKQGLMSKEEAESDSRRNVVTRCVGTREEIETDTYRWNIVPDDILLLCSDGLINMVPDQDILAEIRKDGTAADMAQNLVQMANDNGGKDNTTVVIAKISPKAIRMFKLRVRSIWRSHAGMVLKVILLLLYGLLCLGIGYMLGGGNGVIETPLPPPDIPL